MPDLTFDLVTRDHGSAAALKTVAGGMDTLVAATRKLEDAQIRGRAATVAVAKADQELTAAQARLAKVTADTSASEADKQKALTKVEQAQLGQQKAAVAVRRATEDQASASSHLRSVEDQQANAHKTATAALGRETEMSGRASLSFGRLGASIRGGVGLAVGAAGIGGLVTALQGFYGEAVEAQKTGAQTAAVIKSTGGAAGVTATQVGDLATAISLKAGVDDEAIQSGENLLLTFTNVRNETGKGRDIFNRATQAIVDMTAGMNNGTITAEGLKASTIQVGKALNDPIKGMTALAKVGVTFTEQQKQQIAGFVKHNQLAKAQGVILTELGKEFGGSAAASATAGQKLAVTWGNIQETIGTALLPTFESAATWLSEKLPGAVDTLSGALRPTFSLIGNVGSAIGSLPDPAKAAAIGLAGMAGSVRIFGSVVPKADSAISNWVSTLRGISPAGLAASGGLAAVGIAAGVLVQQLEKGKQDASDFLDILLQSSGVSDTAGQMRVLANALRDTDDATKLNNEQTFQAVVRYKQLQTQQQNETQASKINATAHTGAASATASAGDAAKKATTAVTQLKTAYDLLTAELDRYGGKNLTVMKTDLDRRDSLAAVSKAVHDNGRSLDENTQKGRDNRSAIIASVEAARQHVEAYSKLTGNLTKSEAVWRTDVAAIRTAAEAAGFNKRQVDALIASIAKVPPVRPSKIDLQIAAAQAAAKRIQDAIGKVHGKAVNIQVSQTGTLQRITHDLQYIQGIGTIPVNIKVNGKVLGYSRGGEVRGGVPGKDSVPALLMPGERVLTREQNDAYKRRLTAPATASAGVGAGGEWTVHLHFHQPVGDPQALAREVERSLTKLKRSQGGTLQFQD